MWDSLVNSSIGQTISSLYQDSFVQDAVEGVSSFLTAGANTVDEFRASPLGKLASAGYTYFQGQRKQQMKNLPRAQRVSAPRNTSQQALSAAQKADLGITGRVTSAGQSATRAREGTPISATIQQIAYRRARSPLITVGDSSIKLKSRAK